jgi:hypothetical protein
MQDRLRRLLESQLVDPENAETALLAHAAVRTASWFTDYLKETQALDKLLQLMSPIRAYSLRVLPLLSDSISRTNDLNQFMTIVGSVRETLENSTSHPTQEDVDSVSMTFEHLLRLPPQWLQSAIRDDSQAHGWLHMSEQLSTIVRLLREPENAARAVIRWNSKIPILCEEEDDTFSASTEMEDSDDDFSETTHGGDHKPRRVLVGWLRSLFHRRRKETRGEERSMSEETKSSEASEESDASNSDSSSNSSHSSSSGSSSGSDSSRDSDKEDVEDVRRRFMEGKGGGAGLYSCSAAFDI